MVVKGKGVFIGVLQMTDPHADITADNAHHHVIGDSAQRLLGALNGEHWRYDLIIKPQSYVAQVVVQETERLLREAEPHNLQVMYTDWPTALKTSFSSLLYGTV